MKDFYKACGTENRPATAYHPQSDGQTERNNCVIGDMLRSILGYDKQRDRAKALPAVEFAIIDTFHTAILTTPFRLVYGRDPRRPLSVIPPEATGNVAAARFCTKWSEDIATAKRHLQAAQTRMKATYDVTRRMVEFQVGDQVLLSTKNLNLKTQGKDPQAKKLLPKFIGPFPVVEVVGLGAYRLQIPSHMSRLHDVFNVCLLKPYKRAVTSQHTSLKPSEVGATLLTTSGTSSILPASTRWCGKATLSLRRRGSLSATCTCCRSLLPSGVPNHGSRLVFNAPYVLEIATYAEHPDEAG
eukprot:366571-Chlamydomonas_euryale.AAC.8